MQKERYDIPYGENFLSSTIDASAPDTVVVQARKYVLKHSQSDDSSVAMLPQLVGLLSSFVDGNTPPSWLEFAKSNMLRLFSRDGYNV